MAGPGRGVPTLEILAPAIRRTIRNGLAAALLVIIHTASAQAQDELPLLAQIGPWPVLSSPIGFDGRLWFVNSVKWRNHNSADLYSYDPATGAVRYERHLFSQDGGLPLVAGGRLFLPYEDARFSLGWGHFLVTDGERWELGTIPNGQIFHTHAMAELGGRLVAATSAWRAGLQVSEDGGLTWTQVYDHPTPDRRVSRIVELAVIGDLMLGYLIQGQERRLLRFDGAAVSGVPGWPDGNAVLGLTVRDGVAFAAVREADGDAIWQTDGRSSRRIAGPSTGWRLTDIAADDGGLWAVGGGPDGGRVWRSTDGADWTPAWTVLGGRPVALAPFAGDLYVLGEAEAGGLLWGPRPPAATESAAAPDWPTAPALDVEPDAIDALDQVLAEPGAGTGRAGIRDMIFALSGSKGAGPVFADRLMLDGPDRSVGLIGGRVTISSKTLRRWQLLWGMTLAGEGHVPTELIAEPWTAPQNNAEKYFNSPPAAMRAAAAIGQDDRATIDALIARLAREEDPLWLRGDAIGALTELTGQRFAFDFGAWRAWWSVARDDWQSG